MEIKLSFYLAPCTVNRPAMSDRPTSRALIKGVRPCEYFAISL